MKGLLAEAVLFGEPLNRFTSFGVGGPAQAIVFPGNEKELSDTVSFLMKESLPFELLGNGTNLIVRDGGYGGIIICVKKLNAMDLREEGGVFTIHAGAGVPLADLVSRTMREGLTGMEFCAGLPGTVGGAIRMNAGAYGREIKDVAAAVSFLTREGKVLRKKTEELCFNYRNLAMPPDLIILSAAFSTVRGERREIRQQVKTILAKRRENQPLEYRNAGSIFKNPGTLPAGRLIEELGLKGLKIGGAQISEKHGNFIVNRGRSKAADILALIGRIKEKAWQERGINLEMEVHIIGEDA